MALLTVIRIFVLSILFNMMLPSGDVYSDVYLMYQTWTFQNTDSVEMSGCRDCFGKNVKDLIPKEDDCEKCVTKNINFWCGSYYPFMNFYSSIESGSINKCENKKWRVNDGSLEEGECDNGQRSPRQYKVNIRSNRHYCCFEIKKKYSKMSNKSEEGTQTIHIHPDFLIDCNNNWVNRVSNYFGRPCLLAGKANGQDCLYMFAYREKIHNFLHKNLKQLLSKNLTQIGFKFLGVNFSSKSFSDIELVEIDNLEKHKTFECGFFFKPKNFNIIGDLLDNDCGLDSCKLHLDYLHYRADGMHDLQSWSSKSGFVGRGQRIGGKGCRLLRVYAWSMVFPIIINVIFSGIVFFTDIKNGTSNKYESPFLLTLIYPQWRTLKILIGYFKNNDEEELANKLDENDKKVSFIEPFCESGLQVLTTLSIIFATDAFYPKDFSGYSKNEMSLSVYILLISLFSASFGITKFFVKGPLPILPQDAPLAGVLSAKFLLLFLLNTMFVVRVFCIEGSFFSSYRSYYDRTKNIDPLIPEEYRLIIYLLPALCSFLINLIRLAFSMKPKDFKYFKEFPQFLLCPMFCPLMFEGNPDHSGSNQPPVRLWKIGSILNCIFMGCLPQTLLLVLDHYKGVPSWPFTTESSDGQIERNLYQDNNALLKYPYGNTIFSIATFSFYLFLMTIFFSWDKIFKEDASLCTYCKSIPNPCSSPQSEDSDPYRVDEKENEQVLEQSSRGSTSTGSIQDNERVASLNESNPNTPYFTYSKSKSRKQDANSSNQGLKDMRSSELFGMLVSRRIRQ